MTLMGATGNQPSQYAQPDVPPMCLAHLSPTSGRNDSVANEGIPPVRSGQMVASSARHRHRKQPAIVMTPIRMVPASPITNAPHQLVPLARPFSGAAPSTLVTAIALPFVVTGNRAPST